MAKIKLTKGELKRQRDSLGQFRHYLPTLQLKKQQLQMKIWQVRTILDEHQQQIEEEIRSVESWMGLLGDTRIDVSEWIVPKEILTETTNIAGANLPVFKDILFQDTSYDFYTTPFWIDKGIEKLKDIITLIAKIFILEKQIAILSQELRVTTQRVNLFEKVKIPECLENIRRIRIYLGDQMANAVGIGKVAKKKICAREAQEILA